MENLAGIITLGFLGIFVFAGIYGCIQESIRERREYELKMAKLSRDQSKRLEDKE